MSLATFKSGLWWDGWEGRATPYIITWNWSLICWRFSWALNGSAYGHVHTFRLLLCTQLSSMHVLMPLLTNGQILFGQKDSLFVNFSREDNLIIDDSYAKINGMKSRLFWANLSHKRTEGHPMLFWRVEAINSIHSYTSASTSLCLKSELSRYWSS